MKKIFLFLSLLVCFISYSQNINPDNVEVNNDLQVYGYSYFFDIADFDQGAEFHDDSEFHGDLRLGQDLDMTGASSRIFTNGINTTGSSSMFNLNISNRMLIGDNSMSVNTYYTQGVMPDLNVRGESLFDGKSHFLNGINVYDSYNQEQGSANAPIFSVDNVELVVDVEAQFNDFVSVTDELHLEIVSSNGNSGVSNMSHFYEANNHPQFAVSGESYFNKKMQIFEGLIVHGPLQENDDYPALVID